MINLDTQYEQRQRTWAGFMRFMTYISVATAVLMIGMFIFLV